MFGGLYLAIMSIVFVIYAYSIHRGIKKDKAKFKRQIEELIRKGRH